MRLENMGQKVVPIFHIENNEVVLESEWTAIDNGSNDFKHFFSSFSEGLRESEVIKQAIGLAQIEDCDPEYMMPVLQNLMVCIKNGNCDLPIRNFK